MKLAVNASIVLLLTTLSITGCSSAPEPKDDSYNQADTQRSRAKQAQDELSSETNGK
jgi:PBP1b-binding outer membrane lipoprotein LpoB